MQIDNTCQVSLGKAERSSPSSNQYQITDTPSFFNRGFNAPGATHLSFIQTLQDQLNNGVSNLVDADIAKESANLQALQTKQQLGIQALQIANSSNGALLSLFR